MSWIDRLQEAAYTPPSGERYTLTYEDVAHTFEKKGSAFELTGSDGTYVQPLGKSSLRFPVFAIFHGADCDTEAAAFVGALGENGVGKLEHPIYGTRTVVPLGTIRRRDDLKTRANQSIIQVTFWETIPDLFTRSTDDLAEVVAETVEASNEAASNDFSGNLEGDAANETASARNTYQRVLDTATPPLKELAAVEPTELGTVKSALGTAQSQFDAILSSVTTGLDTAFLQPLTLGRQTLRLIQTPARAFATVTDKITQYQNIVARTVALGVATPTIGESAEAINNFSIADLFAVGAVTAGALAAVNGTPSSDSVQAGESVTRVQTRTQAIEAAETLLSMLSDVTDWREDNFASLGLVDTGETYQLMYSAATLGAAALIQLSFDLRQERSIVLDRARNIVELEFELYGTIDDNIDLLIVSNNLTGSEILELPEGKEILYYV